MALDEALLEVADCLTLRLYSWRPPAVSLGYFQDYAAIAPALPPTIEVVRRITGGGAIWHEHEVTYSLIGWLGRDGLPGLTRELYAPIHGAIRAELVRHGAQLQAQPETVGDRRYRDEPRCFASPAADDLVHADGGKALGSAARARGQRVLLHGSLKLASNPWDGAVVSGCGLSSTAAAACLVTGIAAALGQTPTAGKVSAAESAAAARIMIERYATTGWVQERSGPRA
jgi:lipoyl(octanoyl) transferase